MIKTIEWRKISGTITAPASKSVAQRAVAVASLAKGNSVIRFAGNSDDVKAAIEVCSQLGARIKISNENVFDIKGGITLPSQSLHCGESGLGIRMFSAIAATLSGEILLTGEGSLKSRPMDTIESSLHSAGVSCSTNGGFIPVKVKGPYPGGDIAVDGSMSSQVLTGLLLASPFAAKPSRFIVNNLKSKPYIDITIDVMKAFGVDVVNHNYEIFEVPATGVYFSTDFLVEGDWSGAAFPLVAGAIGGKVKVENLNLTSSQADRAILIALKESGAIVVEGSNYVEVESAPLKAFRFDATHCPDLFPPLVALAAACKGITKIHGVSRLKVKESDRALALKQEFGKLGLVIDLNEDVMHITGGQLKGSTVFSHHDHRIAMACAVASLWANSPVEITEAQVVSKSYPDFYQDMQGIADQ